MKIGKLEIKKENLFWWIFMIVAVFVVILSLSFYIYKCFSKDEKTFVYNIDMKIAAINMDCSLTDDKFHTPQLCNTILFETIKGEKLYREINTCKIQQTCCYHFNIDTKWLYNHQVGDTVHFDYLLKSEFFTIKKKP